MHWAELLIVVIKVLVVFGALLVAVMLMIWFERKVISDMQARIGPNRAGPWGLLQTLADGIKLFFKEDLLPERADRSVFKLAPYLSILPAFLAFAIVPVGGVVTVAGHTFELQLADPPVGILFLLAMSSISVYGVMLAGWSSGSKYPLLGSVRASAQMISYEAALGLTVVMVVLLAGSLSTRAIVDAQAHTFIGSWYIIRTGILPFFLFMIAITAELTRPPFDLVEAEQELVGGFNTEYSSIRFALFFMAEFMNTITMSAIVVTLFLGGPDGPTPHVPSFRGSIPILWFLGKTIVFLFIYVWLRAALPRLRYDQLMDLGWKVLIPLSLGWVLVLAAFLVGRWWGVGVIVALHRGGGAAGAVGPGRFGARRRPRSSTCRGRTRRRLGPPETPGAGAPCPRGGELMGLFDGLRDDLSFLGGFKVTLEQMTRQRVDAAVPAREEAQSVSATTVVTSSTATRTAWRSASAVSCARGCARPTASTCAAPTTPRATRSLRASATGSCTRSTTCAASTATCASRRARPRPSPSPSCSSSPSPTEPTPSTPRTNCWSTTRADRSGCRGRTGARATTCTRRAGCGRRRRRAWRPTRDACSGRGSWGTGCAPPRVARATTATTP